MQNTTPSKIQAIILAAGNGSRFKTGISKLVTPICGQPMVAYPLHVVATLGFPATVIVGYQKELVQAAIEKLPYRDITFVEQKEQLGTGHALLCCKEQWSEEHLLVLNGDMPLITIQEIEQLIKQHHACNAAISFVVSTNIDPKNTFGRIMQSGNSIKIVEKKHFTAPIADHPLVNAGIYLIKRNFLQEYLSQVQQNEVTHEFYLTDLVEVASRNNLPVALVEVPFSNVQGVNTFAELTILEHTLQNNIKQRLMENGVRFINPTTTYLDLATTIDRGTVIWSGAHIENSSIGQFCTINPYAIIKNCVIENNVTIGAHAVIENCILTSGTTITSPQALRDWTAHHQKNG